MNLCLCLIISEFNLHLFNIINPILAAAIISGVPDSSLDSIDFT